MDNNSAPMLITCIIPVGTAKPVMIALQRAKGIDTATLHHARGAGVSGMARRGVGAEVEKDVLMVTVPAERADEIFEFVYVEAGINRPHGGFMYMERVNRVMWPIPFIGRGLGD